jgi:hypothetical protein
MASSFMSTVQQMQAHLNLAKAEVRARTQGSRCRRSTRRPRPETPLVEV